MDRVGLARGENVPSAANDRDAGAVAIFADIDAEGAGLLNGEDRVGCIHFINVTFAHFADAEIDAAFGHAHLCDGTVEVQEREGRHAAEMDGDLACLELSAGVFVDPEFVAHGYGAVLYRVAPIALSARLQGDRAFEQANSSGTIWRISLIRNTCVVVRIGHGVGHALISWRRGVWRLLLRFWRCDVRCGGLIAGRRGCFRSIGWRVG